MTDDGPCFFCGRTLTDLDGILECQEGCGAFEEYRFGNGRGSTPTGINWVVPQEQVLKKFGAGKFNWRRFFVFNILVGLAMQPIVYLILSPYMHFYIGLGFPDDMVKWWISGMPIGIFMNICIAFFLYKYLPALERLTDRIVPR